MEKTTKIYHDDWELESEKDLSFCDLPSFLIKEPEPNSYHHDDQEQRNSFSSQDLFEFLPPDQDTKTNSPQDIIFFGRNMLHKTKQPANSPNPLCFSALLSNRSRRSHSLHVETSKASPTPKLTGSFRDQYSSNNSRKHRVLIGLAKIPPKMELSDIKRRQSRQAPVPMIPAPMLAVDDEKTLITSINGSYDDHQKGRAGLAKPLKCRSLLSRLLTNACFKGCLPLLWSGLDHPPIRHRFSEILYIDRQSISNYNKWILLDYGTFFLLFKSFHLRVVLLKCGVRMFHRVFCHKWVGNLFVWNRTNLV